MLHIVSIVLWSRDANQGSISQENMFFVQLFMDSTICRNRSRLLAAWNNSHTFVIPVYVLIFWRQEIILFPWVFEM